MPNWVYNSVHVAGETGEVETLVEKLGASYEVEGNEVKQAFAFWNVVKPTDLEAYTETVGSSGRSMSDPLGWYEWNCRNWGCKWEANCEDEEAEIQYSDNQTADASFYFDTAWSTPTPIINWLAEYCVKNGLSMDWHYEEEQGWGGEVIVENGTVITREWDIPESHADNASLGKDCVCEYDSDETYWFDDCPLSDEEKERRIAERKEAEELSKSEVQELAEESK